MLRIHEIKLNLEEDIISIPQKIIKKINKKGVEIHEYNIVKQSIDARDKSNIKMVYSVDFTLKKDAIEKSKDAEEELLKVCSKVKQLKLEKAPDREYKYVHQGSLPLKERPVIVGFGPCGIFAALILSQMGYKPLVLERGRCMEERIKDVDEFWNQAILNEESNVQFGEGGAGAFSDGKLTTQIKDPRVYKVLQELVRAGGDEDILYKQKAHIGTDVLRDVVVNMRKQIIKNGGEIRFHSKLTSIQMEDGKVTGVIVNDTELIKTSHVVLAIGHSARDTFRTLFEQGIPMEQKPFSIGVRIEHPQTLINESQYGSKDTIPQLGAADYKLSYHCENGRGVYTFCMCPGGYVVGAASQNGGVVTNGMSYHARDAVNANSALLVDVRREDFMSDNPLAGVEFQEKYERLAYATGGKGYAAPAQRLKDFMCHAKGNKESQASLEQVDNNQGVMPTYQPGITWANLEDCLPDFAVSAMREAIPMLGKKLKGFDSPEAIMTGVETRSSSPIRMIRDQNFMSEILGIYPAGEGAGYTGGIVSAAVDGIKIAEEIASKYKA